MRNLVFGIIGGLALLFLSGGVGGVSDSSATHAPVQNPGFETGTLAGWDVAAGSVASAITTLGPGGSDTPILPPEGSWMARVDTAGSVATPPGTTGSVISQTFDMPADAEKLEFCYRFVSNDSTTFENFGIAELATGSGTFVLGSADNSAGSPAGGAAPPPPPAISAGVTLTPAAAPVFLSGVNILGSPLFIIASSLMTLEVCSSFVIPAAVRGTEVTLSFTAGDVLDTAFNSVFLVDDIRITRLLAVGGIVDLNVAADQAATSEPRTSSIGYFAAFAAILGAALIAGGWFARRRWLA